MRIIVDADACPGKDIIESLGKEHGLEIIMYCDINHVLNSSYSTIKYMDSGFQSVDMAVANEAKERDIVVTQDFGVAAMVLGKKCFAISPKGYVYDNNNIDKLLFERHISSKVRRSGGKTFNAKKRNKEDDERLYRNLLKLINS
ncbi:YaiI/YqxD family protein [Candidatus Clostridium stratigraminis]|uniref:YaiI/YqxD family protein n=1 Tax=Candidatus Clostridium stratigraminis TaxID=3381661 RepID=A0ABW8T1Q6_9CLOT